MARVRSPLGALRRILAESPHPIWLLDHQRTIVFVNDALERWWGVPAKKILGSRAEYHWDSGLPAATGDSATLAPPPEIYQSPRLIYSKTLPTTPPQQAPNGAAPENSIQPTARDAGTVVSEVDAGLKKSARDGEGKPSEPGTEGERPAGEAEGIDLERGVLFLPFLGDKREVVGVLGIAATENGALAPPFPLNTEEGLEARELHRQLGHLRRHLQQFYDLPQLIGKSAALVRIRTQVELAAASDGRTVVKGRVGSGREHVARSIHYLSDARRERFLIPLSGSLLDAELLESAIMDFVEGPREIGIESPMTILLLDADRLILDAQSALMRILRESGRNIHTLTTSERCLIELSREGSFREDLAYHLSTLVIELPELGARPDDIPLLAQYLLERHNASSKKQLSGFSSEAMDRLVSYPWPGNLDQLVEVVRECHGRAAGVRVEEGDLPDLFHHADQAVAHPRPVEDNIHLNEMLRRVETELLRRALRRSRGNRARAARLLGISRARLLRRLAQLDVKVDP